MKNQKDAPYASRCPVTGLPVLKKPDWTDYCVGNDYKISCTLIGENILFSQPCGRSTLQTTREAVALFARIVEELFPDGRPYIQIEDFTHLISHTFEGRKYYINSMQANQQIAGLIFFGLSPILTTSIKLGKRLSLVNFNIELCKDYSEAIQLARKIALNSTQNNGTNANRTDPAVLSEKPLFSRVDHEINVPIFRKRKFKVDRKMQLLIDELLTGISSISWDRDYAYTDNIDISPEHPFYPIFQAISIIKKDIDQLFQEKKSAGNALKRSEEKYRTIIEEFEDGYYEIDLKGNFTFLNQAMSQILGFTKDAFIGTNYRALADPETARKLKGVFNEVFNTGLSKKHYEFQITTNEGEKKYIELSISLIQSENEPPTGFRGTMRDIDVRKRTQKEKRELELKLVHAQKMEALGRLAGGVAHDLNNVLSGVINYPELLLLDLPDNHPLQEPLKKIQQSGNKAAAIVQDLLTLARRAVTQTTVLNLNNIIHDYLSSPEHKQLMEGNRNITVITELDYHLQNVPGSAIHLMKTVMNLINNAVEAQEEGGKIVISTRNEDAGQVVDSEGKLHQGTYVRLTVEDHGSGIDEKDLPHIFEPFYTKKVMGKSGTGLGMAVVWGTVKDHKGFISIKSKKNEGTTFDIYLPATSEEIDMEQEKIDLDYYRGNGETVLVIDDINDQRELAMMLLTKLNYSAFAVESGEKAIEFLKERPVDILLLDMIMAPGMDGFETYREIIKHYPGQKALITSGFSDSKKVSAAQALGAGNYVKKPYSIEQLGIELKAALNH